ncbi:hypothetical protein [Humisphaera borealis]|uniref:Uncharacterized protein n=1 Tax=Humisphaera borealis TaxID=2807512 RepID=A0A7M2X0J5_9BACT|nr:hypothetical protein [Humisphaera borealis]QOV91169.1 hypothetical protein IPV69_07365 [Humisphaera borealis]
MHRTTIHLEAFDKPFSVIVEPWAAPLFEIQPGERCEIVVEHPSIEPTVTAGVLNGTMYLTVYESGSTFRFVRQGEVEFEMPIAIPMLTGRLPGEA